MHVQPELREPALVMAFDGWNDAGEAATSALAFVNEAIHSVPLADIDPDDFYDFTVRRPTVTPLSESLRRIEWPGNEFRYGSVDSAREIVLGPASDPEIAFKFANECLREFLPGKSITIRRSKIPYRSLRK